jgi:tetratricopeptide (TPR) repeat protein
VKLSQPKFLVVWFALSVSFVPSVWAETSKTAASSAQQEKIDRLVDRAALIEANRAIKTTLEQLKKTQRLKLGHEREEMLLFKLGDLQHQRAELEFRVGMHQKSDGKYRKALEESIRTLTEVATRFPHTEEMARLLFLRARAYSDLDKPQLAEKDFLKITDKFPEFEQVDSARVALAGIYTERTDHKQAIQALKPIRANPESAFYPHALQQMAWSYFNLEQTDEAIEAAFDVVKHLRAKIDAKEAGNTDSSVMERAMQDIATFYGEAVERDPQTYTPAAAWKLFTQVQKKSELDESVALSPMSIRLAKILRSKSMGKELKEWASLLWKERPTLETTVSVDYLMREYSDLQNDWKVSLEIPPIAKAKADSTLWESHRKLYSSIQARIQELLKKNPNAPVEKSLPWLERLEQSYIAFLAITADSKDPRYFQAELQLLRAQLAVLDQKKLRRKFEIVASSAKSPGLVAAYAPVLARMERLIPQLPKDQLAPLLLEKSKMHYEQGERALALQGLDTLVSQASGKQGQTEARAALAALLDQSILDEDRARLEQLISKRRDFKGDDAALSLMDKAELQRDVLVLKKPKDASEKAGAIDRLVARKDLPVDLSDYALGEKATLLRTQIEPQKLGELLGLLSRQSKPEINAAPILLLAYSKGEENAWLTRPGFCQTTSTQALCAQLTALRQLDLPLSKTQGMTVLKELLKTHSAPDRALQGLRLLAQAKGFGFKDRSSILRAVARGWKDLHPVLQWQLLPRWLKGSTELLSLQASTLRTISPISVPHQASEAHLVHRMDLLKSFENLSKDLSEMGLLETALASLDAQVQVTADFSEDLNLVVKAPGAPGELAGLLQGVAGKVEALRKTAAEEKTKLGELVAKTEPRIQQTQGLGFPKSFDASKLPSHVWAFLKSQDFDPATRNHVLARILWNQGARHAAAQLLPATTALVVGQR